MNNLTKLPWVRSNKIYCILFQVLSVIAKERLHSPQMVIEAIGTANSNITLGDVRSYITSELTKEMEVTQADTELTDKYKKDTKALKQQLRTLQNGVNVIQV